MKKRFGQHILADKNYLHKIIDVLRLSQDDIILEIGSGSGLLTCLLATKVKKVFAVEIERDILKKLKDNLSNKKLKNVEIIESDILKLDFQKLINTPFKIIGNIPYNITSLILIKLFGEIDNPAPHLKLLRKVYLMLQLEVARRITASKDTKEYSPLTLLVQYFSKPKILFRVPAGVFYPVPKVDSAFVDFHIKEKLVLPPNPTFLKSIIRTAFQQRRKKVINSLSKLFKNKDDLVRVFNELKLHHNLRAENLDFDTYLNISNLLIKHQ